MKTIRETLDTLQPKQRAQLLCAFEQDVAQFIALPDNRYVGVNANRIRSLIPESTAGAWSIGRVRNG